MATPAIRVDSVGKQYRLGPTTRHTSLAERFGSMLRVPGRSGAVESGTRASDPEEFWALRDVSLEVQPGEVVGLIGANGAGKSTLLKLLARVASPTEGRIELVGRVGTLLEVGTGFHPELSGRENAFLSGAILGMGRREVADKFDQIVEFAGVEEFIETPVKRYSSGMYVRLAFAVAAFLEPEILLIDEVLAVGDAEFQRRCLGRMQDVVDEGRTIIFVSHNLSAIQRLCPNSHWIREGRLAASGPSDEVIASYLRESGSRQSGGVATVEPDVARVGTGGARLTRASLIGGEGEASDRIALGEKLAIEMTFEVAEPIDDGVVEVGVTSAEGVRVVMVQSIDARGELLELQAGTCELRVDLDLDLLPGQYHVDIGLHRLVGLTFDLVERVLTFAAINTTVDGSHHYPWNVVRGSVRAASSWSVAGSGRIGPPVEG